MKILDFIYFTNKQLLIFSWHPSNHINGLLRISWHQWMAILFLLLNLLQLWKTLLELLFGWWILSTIANQLNCVQSGLLVEVAKELYNFVKFIEIVNLNFSFFVLSERIESSSGCGSYFGYFVRKHDAKWRNGHGIDGLFLSDLVVTNGSQIHRG